MSYEPGALQISLAAAVGDDPALVAELSDAFLSSAAAMADLLGRSRCDANWQTAAWRLHGLAASFGAMDLMLLAEDAAQGVPGDPVALRRINQAIVTIGG